MAKHVVSPAVARLLRPTVHLADSPPLTPFSPPSSLSSSPLTLTPASFFHQDGKIDGSNPSFVPYKVPYARRDWGIQPSGVRDKSTFSLVTWNISGEHRIVSHPRFIAICAALRQTPPTVLCLHDVRREHEEWLRKEPRFQFNYAMSSLNQWDKDVAGGKVAERGGTIVCVDKRFFGIGTMLHFAAFPSSEEARGMAVLELATEGVTQLRIATGQFEQAMMADGHANRTRQYTSALDLLTKLDAGQRVPTLFAGDFGNFPSPDHLRPFFSTPQRFLDAVATLAPTEEQQMARATMSVTYPWQPVPASRTQAEAMAKEGKPPPMVLRRREPSRPDLILVSSPNDEAPTQVELLGERVLGAERVVSSKEAYMLKQGRSEEEVTEAHARLRNRLGRDGFVYPSQHLGVQLDARLIFRPGSRQAIVHARKQAGRKAFEAERDVPLAVKSASGRVKAVIEAHADRSEIGVPGKPFSRRKEGRPVPMLRNRSNNVKIRVKREMRAEKRAAAVKRDTSATAMGPPTKADVRRERRALKKQEKRAALAAKKKV